MEIAKPALVPAIVPWAISTSAPYLKLHEDKEGNPSSLTFIGYFKLNDKGQDYDRSSVVVVEGPGEFRLDSSADGAVYRLIRVMFEGGIKYRRCFSVSDHEVIPEANYDWSEVPGSLRPGEDALTNMTRTDHYWIETGQSPDPSYYEVRNSPWINEIGINDPELRHYIAAGQDEYFEIIARGWRWEAGQQA